jgi:hypothetical protein
LFQEIEVKSKADPNEKLTPTPEGFYTEEAQDTILMMRLYFLRGEYRNVISRVE